MFGARVPAVLVRVAGQSGTVPSHWARRGAKPTGPRAKGDRTDGPLRSQDPSRGLQNPKGRSFSFLGAPLRSFWAETVGAGGMRLYGL